MMRTLPRHGCWLWMLGVLWACTAFAQTTSQTLLSFPPRAELQLAGAVQVNGISPLLIEEPLRGDYVLTASKPGFVVQKTRLRFPEGGGPAQPTGSSPITGVGGAVRTMLLPGAGQWAAGEKGHGAALLLTEFVAVSMVVKSEHDVRKAQTAYDLATAQIQAGGSTVLSPADQVGLNVLQQHAANLHDDAGRARTRWLLMAGVAWGYSVLDQVALRGGLRVQPRGLDTLAVLMEPVSRGQAVLRSFLVPGAGQAYAGHRSRGTLLLMLSTGLTTFAMAGEHHYDRTLSEFHEAEMRYSELVSVGADVDRVNAASAAVQQRYGDATSARRTRNTFWALAVGAWGLNLLDAAMMDIPAPDNRHAGLNRADGLYTHIDPGSVQLGFRRGF
jgi:hypothetical protein